MSVNVTTFRFNLDGDYYAIVAAGMVDRFRAATRTAIAVALNISETYVT
jgi:hypothetical protein